jgi:putative acetyltransferase
MNLSLRPGTEADLPAILDLWVEAWTATMPELDFASRRDWLAMRQRSMVAEGAVIIVAFNGDRMVGYALVNPDNAYLDQIAVAPDARGSGVALQVLEAARKFSPGQLTLHVNQKNARAIRFYEREGFVRSGEGINPNSGLPIFFYSWRPAGMAAATGTPSSPN